MTVGFDAYSLVARILPGYITIVPLTLPLLLTPGGVQLSLGAAALLLPVLYFIAYQIGRARGEKKEKQLWRKWGGPPTTRFLRHSNGEYDADKRKAVHEKLRHLGLKVPTIDEEERDPQSTDKCYGHCTFEIIRRTRNLETYPLVLRTLISYGLQRNLFGLKYIAIVIALLSLSISCIIAIFSQTPLVELGPTAFAILINLGLFLIWAFGVTETRVKFAAEEYAQHLFEAALNLDE